MANENALWKTLQRNMKGRWIAQRFEDKLSYGIPDVGYVIKQPGQHYGFIELKRIPSFPKRPNTPVRIPHKQHWKVQQAWIRRIGQFTGQVFLLLQVEREYFLFDWEAVQEVGEVPRNRLLYIAVGHWTNRINYSQLEEKLMMKWGVDDVRI